MVKNKKQRKAWRVIRKVRAIIQDNNRHIIHVVEMDCHAGRKLGLPGGGINPGEHPRDAAEREGAEETGLRIKAADKPVVVIVERDKKARVKTVTWCYLARIVGRCRAKLSRTERRKRLRSRPRSLKQVLKMLAAARRKGTYGSAGRDLRLLLATA